MGACRFKVDQTSAEHERSCVKVVYRNWDLTKVGYYKTILDEAQIQCFIRNEMETSAMGFGRFYSSDNHPALCVVNDEDYNNAILILEKHEDPEELTGEAWNCPKCEEEVPGEYDTCWNCQETMPKS